MKISSSITLLVLSASCWADLPVSFTQAPVVKNLALGQQQTLEYVIHNNVLSKALPIRSIQVVNDGDSQAQEVTSWTSTCGAFLPANGNCTITVNINQATGNVNRHLSINYGGRSPLVSPIQFRVNQAKYTVMVYIIGSDLQSNAQLADFNITQMMQVGSTENMNIILETGGASGGYQNVKRHIVYPGAVNELEDLGSVAMGAPSTVQDFLQWGIQNYPAERYVTIFWDHGGGPNGGFGGDENNSPRVIAINDLAQVVNNVSANAGKPFEIVGFDACLMGSAETAAGLIPGMNYFLASEDLEPGKGWQYNTFLNYINTHPNADGEAVGKVIIDGYIQQNQGDSTTLSLLDGRQLSALNQTISQFAEILNTKITSAENWKTIASARFKSADYSTSVWDNQSVDVVDLLEMAQRVGAAFPSDFVLNQAAQAVIAAVNESVLYNRFSVDREDSHGITVYFPSILNQYQTDYPQKLLISGLNYFSTSYLDLVTNYHNYYLNNVASLAALINNLNFDGTTYTATVNNDYNELYAAVGLSSCNNLLDENNQPSDAAPCFNSIQYEGINAVEQGNNWAISFDKASHSNSWPQLNNVPVLLIPDDATPSNPGETNFLIPATWVEQNSDGYLNIIRDQNGFRISGFQKSLGSSNTAAKTFPIDNDATFRIRALAQSGNLWVLTRTSQIVSAPFTISSGTAGANDGFSFLTADMTGALNTSNPLFVSY